MFRLDSWSDAMFRHLTNRTLGKMRSPGSRLQIKIRIDMLKHEMLNVVLVRNQA